MIRTRKLALKSNPQTHIRIALAGKGIHQCEYL